MVARHDPNLNVTEMDSRNLKFGVDRILSADISSTKKPDQDNCSSMTSCLGCISAFHKGNRPCSLVQLRPFYKNQVLMPQPLRPFATVIFSNDGTVGDLREKESEMGSRSKRKRSWSRAVFSNLQRKGLEKRFQLQKYITKPDRRQLAATLGLTDAQVKVWFQNRRMKWRHAKDSSRQKVNPEEKTRTPTPDSGARTPHDTRSRSGSEVEVDVHTVPQ